MIQPLLFSQKKENISFYRMFHHEESNEVFFSLASIFLLYEVLELTHQWTKHITSHF